MSNPVEIPSVPTISDLFALLNIQRLESRADMAEMKAGISTIRLESNNLWQGMKTLVEGLKAGLEDVKDRLDAVETRLVTLFDELAAFRAEYNDHTHE